MTMAVYIKYILNLYREETDGTTPINPPPIVITRTGRQSKRPIKLNL